FAHRASRGQRQNNYDQNGRHGPSQLDGGTAVDLRRLGGVVISRFFAVSNDRVKKQSPDPDKNAQTDQQDQYRGLVQEFRRRADRGENILDRSYLFGTLCTRPTGPNCDQQQNGSPKQGKISFWSFRASHR